MSADHILIVKLSSLGDIIQSFPVLHLLHEALPGVQIDWAVEASMASLVAAHPLVRQAIPLDLRGAKKSWDWHAFRRDIGQLRAKKYDSVIDLQKNTKSGLITLLAKSSTKVGFGWRSVREWPNVLATNVRFEVAATDNMRQQYLSLVEQFLKRKASANPPSIRLHISDTERAKIGAILQSSRATRSIMVCPGSRWRNKQLPVETMIAFLQEIVGPLDGSLFLMWGNADERAYVEQIQRHFPERSQIIDPLSLPVWQNLMAEMNLVIAVDSAALHLCGTTSTPSFSLFGPTAPALFKPIGTQHGALQGTCPYNTQFIKQCPRLRTCATGACLRQMSVESICQAFWSWWHAGALHNLRLF